MHTEALLADKRARGEAIIRDQPLLTLKGHTRLVNRAAFSPDGARIASAGGDGDATVKIWNSQTAALLFTLKGHHRGVYNLAFSPDGKQVASSGAGQMVNLWDADNAKALSTFKGQTMPAFSLDGKRLVSSGLDQTVNIWNLVD